MARTTESDVQTLLAGDYDGSTSLAPHVATATAIVDRVATCATAKGATLSSTELELVERWLAAHCYAMIDQPYQSKTTGRASAVFQGRTGMGFAATKYGQTALALDYSGCLANIGRARRARVAWLGLAPSEQTPYVDRD